MRPGFIWRWLGKVEEPNCYASWSPLLLGHRIRHRFSGLRRGCSCSTCFHHPRRRVPNREHLSDRVHIADLERRLRTLERR